MKKLIFLLILISAIQSISAQDTSIVNYFPMSIGNTWVYNCNASGSFCSCSQRRQLKISGTVVRNSKTYFIFQSTVRNLNCLSGGCLSFTITIDTIRIDPVSGNILRPVQNGCAYSTNESMEDSLREKIHDTLKVNCGTFNGGPVCTDTNSVNLFGINCSKRTHALNFVDSYTTMSYARGFGIYFTGSGGQTCTTQMNLTGCIVNGVLYGDTSMLVGINKISSEVPDKFSLSQNYPNPFNPSTIIKFQVAGDKFVKLIIYDAIGREVETLVDKKLEPGEYETEFPASTGGDVTNLPSGVYYYKLSAGEYTETKKMVLIK